MSRSRHARAHGGRGRKRKRATRYKRTQDASRRPVFTSPCPTTAAVIDSDVDSASLPSSVCDDFADNLLAYAEQDDTDPDIDVEGTEPTIAAPMEGATEDDAYSPSRKLPRFASEVHPPCSSDDDDAMRMHDEDAEGRMHDLVHDHDEGAEQVSAPPSSPAAPSSPEAAPPAAASPSPAAKSWSPVRPSARVAALRARLVSPTTQLMNSLRPPSLEQTPVPSLLATFSQLRMMGPAIHHRMPGAAASDDPFPESLAQLISCQKTGEPKLEKRVVANSQASSPAPSSLAPSKSQVPSEGDTKRQSPAVRRPKSPPPFQLQPKMQMPPPSRTPEVQPQPEPEAQEKAATPAPERDTPRRSPRRIMPTRMTIDSVHALRRGTALSHGRYQHRGQRAPRRGYGFDDHDAMQRSEYGRATRAWRDSAAAYDHLKEMPEARYVCPATGNARIRLVLHRAAEAMGGKSQSQGEGLDRQVVMWMERGATIDVDISRFYSDMATIIEDIFGRSIGPVISRVTRFADGRVVGMDAADATRTRHDESAIDTVEVDRRDDANRELDRVYGMRDEDSGDARATRSIRDGEGGQAQGGRYEGRRHGGGAPAGRHNRSGDGRTGGQGQRIEQGNRGYDMMSRMGWQEGDGLGADSSGRRDPVEAVPRGRRSGLGR